ncbi:MAG: hypothetical protein ABL880_09580 [Methylotenera sp.]
MKLMNAFFKHAWFALSLKHDGTGLPTRLPAACMLIGLYFALNLANSHIGQSITLETLLGLSFIAQFYLFSLRTPLIGLFIVIGIITNALTLALTALTGTAEQPHYLLTLIEYIMVFAAIVNIIKHELKTI